MEQILQVLVLVYIVKMFFLEGGIVANTGSIAGIEMEAGKLYTGVGTHGKF